MGGVPGDFDVGALFEAVDEQAERRGMSLSQVNKEIAWMSLPTLKRMRERGGSASCQHVMPLIQWVGRTPESFTLHAEGFEGALLPDPRPGRWRWYWNMPELAAAVDQQAHDRGMTLADVGDELGCGLGAMKHLRETRYGTTISVAMRVSRWLGRTATSFLWEHDGRGLPWSGRRV
jgi:hypothetical protein